LENTLLECLLCLALSPLLNTYDSSIRADGLGVHVAAAAPVYVFGSYEEGHLQIVGQTSRLKIWGAGAGYRTDFGKARVFVEAGRYWPSASADEAVRDEFVEQVLVNDHGDPGWCPTNFSYRLHNGWGGRVGVGLQMTRRLSAFAAYRFLAVDEDFDMCTGDDPACTYPVDGKHWQNREKRSLSSIQVGITLEIGQ